MNTQDILQFIETSRKKLEALTKPCWICGKDTNAWVPIFPENGEMESLGFGKPTEGRTRIAWAPICITYRQ